MVHKHYPLSFHPNARPAAEAAEFAKKHGKFWEMHDLLFVNYRTLSIDNLKSFGRQLGLDEKALEESVTKQAFKLAIDKDFQDGAKAQVSGTPTVFVNGKRLRQRSFEEIKKMVDEALAAAAPASK